MQMKHKNLIIMTMGINLRISMKIKHFIIESRKVLMMKAMISTTENTMDMKMV